MFFVHYFAEGLVVGSHFAFAVVILRECGVFDGFYSNLVVEKGPSQTLRVCLCYSKGVRLFFDGGLNMKKGLHFEFVLVIQRECSFFSLGF